MYQYLIFQMVCQPLASNGNQSPFSRYFSNDILIVQEQSLKRGLEMDF